MCYKSIWLGCLTESESEDIPLITNRLKWTSGWIKHKLHLLKITVVKALGSSFIKAKIKIKRSAPGSDKWLFFSLSSCLFDSLMFAHLDIDQSSLSCCLIFYSAAWTAVSGFLPLLAAAPVDGRLASRRPRHRRAPPSAGVSPHVLKTQAGALRLGFVPDSSLCRGISDQAFTLRLIGWLGEGSVSLVSKERKPSSFIRAVLCLWVRTVGHPLIAAGRDNLTSTEIKKLTLNKHVPAIVLEVFWFCWASLKVLLYLSEANLN